MFVSRPELQVSMQSFNNPIYFKWFLKAQNIFSLQMYLVSMGSGGVLAPKATRGFTKFSVADWQIA